MATTTETRKTERIELRATQRQETLLKKAAEATNRTLSEFLLSSGVREAERVLADQSVFAANSDEYQRFLEMLDEPGGSDLAKLWSQPSPFGKPVELR